MSTFKQIIVTRSYRPAPDYCAHALVTLLKSSVNKKADKPAPEPVGRDGTEIQGDSANDILPH